MAPRTLTIEEGIDALFQEAERAFADQHGGEVAPLATVDDIGRCLDVDQSPADDDLVDSNEDEVADVASLRLELEMAMTAWHAGILGRNDNDMDGSPALVSPPATNVDNHEEGPMLASRSLVGGQRRVQEENEISMPISPCSPLESKNGLLPAITVAHGNGGAMLHEEEAACADDKELTAPLCGITSPATKASTRQRPPRPSLMAPPTASNATGAPIRPPARCRPPRPSLKVRMELEVAARANEDDDTASPRTHAVTDDAGPALAAVVYGAAVLPNNMGMALVDGMATEGKKEIECLIPKEARAQRQKARLLKLQETRAK